MSAIPANDDEENRATEVREQSNMSLNKDLDNSVEGQNKSTSKLLEK
jgi:hypothetical protein